MRRASPSAHRVLRLVGRHADLQLVRRDADLERGDAELERRLARDRPSRSAPGTRALRTRRRAHQFERLLPAPGEERVPGHLAHAAAQREHADVDVRAPAGLDLQLDRRVVAAQRDDARLDHAFALDRDQRGRLAERHAHLQPRGLAGLVALLLGQHVDAVVVVLREPELALLRDPDASPRPAPALPAASFALAISSTWPAVVERRLAQQQAAVVGRAAAQRAELLDLGAVVVGVEAADHALARADDLAQRGRAPRRSGP